MLRHKNVLQLANTVAMLLILERLKEKALSSRDRPHPAV